MIQFNLLPDIKFQYLKARRLQRIVVSGSVVAVAICIFVVALLFVFTNIFEKNHIRDLTNDINTNVSQLRSINGLDKIITIQNQLETLPGLYKQDPTTSRIFGFIVQLTPPNVTIGDLTLDFTQNTMEIQGTAPSLDNVNAYADSLKKATYDDGATGAKNVPAFSGVTLSSFGRTSAGASYTFDMSFDPILFQPDEKITLNVPKTTNLPQVPGINGKIFQALPSGGGNG